MQPQALTWTEEGRKVPAPSKLKANCCWLMPAPLGKTCTFRVPVGAEADVNCMMSVRLLVASGRPLGVPFSTYQAPPVMSSMTKFWPAIAEFALKAPIQGWSDDSIMLMAVSGGVGADSMPTVTQLSNANSGAKPNKFAFTPSAADPVANGLL